VDNREKNSLVPSELMSKGFKIKFEHLAVGDYLLGKTCIERKTYPDFISSMINKRIFRQLKEIKRYDEPTIILESPSALNPEKEKTSLDKAAKGLMLSIVNDYKIPLIFSSGPEETVDFIELIAKRKNKIKTEMSMRISATPKNSEEQKRFVLEGFPGIGASISKRLLEKFKTLKNVFNASDNELEKIERFDKNKITKFKEVLEN
jgi:Fanconi anemia group M protein